MKLNILTYFILQINYRIYFHGLHMGCIVIYSPMDPLMNKVIFVRWGWRDHSLFIVYGFTAFKHTVYLTINISKKHRFFVVLIYLQYFTRYRLFRRERDQWYCIENSLEFSLIKQRVKCYRCPLVCLKCFLWIVSGMNV